MTIGSLIEMFSIAISSANLSKMAERTSSFSLSLNHASILKYFERKSCTLILALVFDGDIFINLINFYCTFYSSNPLLIESHV